MTATRDITCVKCGEKLAYVRSEQGWMFFRCSTHGIVAIDSATLTAEGAVTSSTPAEPRKG
jgi:hypothetical protein